MKLKFTVPILLLIWAFSFQLYGQADLVKGTVRSTEGDPLIGANVLVVGTQTGTVTDLDGRYEIKASKGDVLLFTYVGFEDKEFKVGNNALIDVVLGIGVSLDEVVVTALGITREKKALAYAVDQINADEIARSGQTNIVSALQGKVAGVQIQNTSGAPGAGTDILIRGVTSLDPNRSNRPLYIIDGIEISDNTNVLPVTPSAGSNAVSSSTQAAVSNRAVDINPEDIESLTVLKGAQATALYGIRAANGVILITTKKGKTGKPQIDVHYGQGWENVNKVPLVQMDFIDGHYNTSLPRSGYVWDMWGAKVFADEGNPIRDIYSEFFQTGSVRNYGASVSTGSEKFTFRLSADRYDHEGTIPNSYWNKTNFSISGGSQLSDKLYVNASVRYAKSGGNRPHAGDKSILSTLSYMPTVADPNHYDEPYVFGDNFAAAIIDHPLFLANNNTYIDDVNRYISGITFDYKAFKNLGFRYTIGMDNFSDARTRIVHPETDEGFQVHGFLIEQTLNEFNLTSNLMANWHYDVNESIKLSGVLGQDMQLRSNKWVSTRGEGFVLDNFYNLNNTTNPFQENSAVNQRNIGVFGDITASYNDYLYLTLTARNDWSSTLPTQNNSYFFPSASLSWVLSDMMTMPGFVNLAKLRVSYAIVGKDADPYKVGRYYEKSSNFPFGDVLGFRQSTLIGDENLKPEFTNSLELGGEFSLFNNRFGLDVSWYQNNITDMILSVPISNATGAARYVTNAGNIQTEGIEILAMATLVKNRDFSWETSLNWSTNSGRVKEIAEGISDIELFSIHGITNKYVRGGEIGDLYGYNYEKTSDGQLVIDPTGYPNVVWDSLTLVGNAMPDWIAGWTNTFNYKGISFSFLWEWKHGGDVYDVGRRNSLRNGQNIETVRRYEQVIFDGVQVVKDEDGNIISTSPNDVPVELTGGGFYRNSTRYNYAADVLLEDASWIRLRNVGVSYKLPASLFDGMFIEGVTLSLTANNLYLNTGTLGYDPETNYFGSGSNIYGYTGLRNPATKSYFLKANIQF